jgi:DNA helicase-2/ATP-dependent DNA helicase PcrA
MPYPPALQRLLDGCNEEQRQAIDTGPGLAALVGAPGSGKTRCIVGRIARLVHDGLFGQYILAVTFTRTAAWEMNVRLVELGVTGCRVGTIHSVANQILDTEWALYKGKLISEFRLGQIVDQTVSQLKKNGVLRSLISFDRQAVLDYIEECKSTGVCILSGNPLGSNDVAHPRQLKLAEPYAKEMKCSPMSLVTIYQAVEDSRHASNGLTYDDMQLWAWMLLLCREDIRKKWRYKWSTIIVDEAQDSSLIQWDFARLLAGLDSQAPEAAALESAPERDDYPHNLMVAADGSQSLYSFRYAVPEMLVEFALSEDVQLQTLPRNYRSVPSICSLGYELVKDYEWHLVGEIKPVREEGEIDSIKVREYPSVLAEAQGIIEIARAQRSFQDIAVLCRLSAFLHLVEVECIRNKIPYVKRAKGSFTDAPEVLDLLAYLRLANGSEDNKVISRVINAPYRYISGWLIKEALAEARPGRGKGMEVVRYIRRHRRLSMKQRRRMGELQDLLLELLEKDRPPVQELKMVIEATGYSRLRRGREEAPDEAASAVISTLVAISEQHENTEDFLIYMDRLKAAVATGQRQLKRKDLDKGAGDFLVLSTIHRAKGLEFPVVVVADVVQGRCPCKLSDNYEEEVRLFYVAVTRAANQVFITHSRNMSSQQMSPFVLSTIAALGSREKTEPQSSVVEA